MATNYIQRGDHITIAAPSTVTGGMPVFAGEIVGIALQDAPAGAPCDVATFGVFELPKVAADAVDLGDPVYWDEAAELVTTDDNTGANPRLGVAVTAAAAMTGVLRIRLSGF